MGLLSCAFKGQTEPVSPGFDPADIKAIALLPITYDQGHAPPPRQDLIGIDLSAKITRQIRKTLAAKGYLVTTENFPADVKPEGRFDPLKIEPSVLAEGSYSGTDGLMQIHVTFHYGLYPAERSFEEDPFSPIELQATARLIKKREAAEIWRGRGRARPFYSSNFSSRLNYAVYTLSHGLLRTFPER